MPVTFSIPSAASIKAIEQEVLPRLLADRPVFDICPLVNEDTDVVAWEIEQNFRGLQKIRGISGTPETVKKSQYSRFVVAPGYYGEYLALDELELTKRRVPGTFGTPIDIHDLVMRASSRLQLRFLDRVESTIWNIMGGTYSVLGQSGFAMALDSFPVQTYTAASWSSTATATPYKDFKTISKYGIGKGVSFGRGAKAFMNGHTLNNMLENANASDLFGRRRLANFGPISGLDELNSFLLDADCPQIMEYNEGYFDETTGSFNLFIPDGTVYIVGQRPAGSVIMDYCMTKNVNNPDGESGQYTKVIDKGATQVPRVIEVHNGHNGGPRIYYPSAIIKMVTT